MAWMVWPNPVRGSSRIVGGTHRHVVEVAFGIRWRSDSALAFPRARSILNLIQDDVAMLLFQKEQYILRVQVKTGEVFGVYGTQGKGKN